jgi:hypothetical protein
MDSISQFYVNKKEQCIDYQEFIELLYMYGVMFQCHPVPDSVHILRLQFVTVT